MKIKEVSAKYNISQDTLRYYENIGVIPQVTRDKNGIRCYSDDDLRWIELAICLRGAGLALDVLIEYRKLFTQGNSTIEKRYDLLKNQKEQLINQKKQIDETIDRLDYKIKIYEEAMKTGKFPWEEN